MKSRSIYLLLLTTGILALGARWVRADSDREVEWSARLGRISPVDGVIGSGSSFGLSAEWGGGKGGLLATIDLASLDSGGYGRGGFLQKTLGLAYTSRRVRGEGAESGHGRQFWWGGGLALIDELDKVTGYTVFVGCDLSRRIMLEARHSQASRWGFDYGGTNISVSWRLSRAASP